ncbi:hypothetical protein PCH_Pc22g00540 [Penicillium rubens Wisconsin 54-1255]|uniref:Uncharacterized protein n=1 Tax=Penicillium rubens (strain ATCC 28089 / DSM 1075 / NRRL 1951 / Wisconsin 54-1255) TaxID=500485 RepID=B6HPG8_PENRW|nr:hypothetical protein PCH_Pc22g00540 [Penicillium rubens Wisconsin 54-1255]
MKVWIALAGPVGTVLLPNVAIGARENPLPDPYEVITISDFGFFHDVLHYWSPLPSCRWRTPCGCRGNQGLIGGSWWLMVAHGWFMGAVHGVPKVFRSFSADLNNVERSKRVGIDPNRGTGSTSVNLNCRIAGPPDRTIEIWETQLFATVAEQRHTHQLGLFQSCVSVSMYRVVKYSVPSADQGLSRRTPGKGLERFEIHNIYYYSVLTGMFPLLSKPASIEAPIRADIIPGNLHRFTLPLANSDTAIPNFLCPQG